MGECHIRFLVKETAKQKVRAAGSDFAVSVNVTIRIIEPAIRPANRNLL
jgi:hypothetical protein